MFEKIKSSVIKIGRRNKCLLPFAVIILFAFNAGQRMCRRYTNLSEETLITLWRGKLRRGMALTLCFCMIFGMIPPSVLAKEAENGYTVLSGFAALPDDVREQTVPRGTSLNELNLPDTVEAVYSLQEETITEIPEETATPETEPEETATPETEPEETATPEAGTEEATTPEEETMPEETPVQEPETEPEEAATPEEETMPEETPVQEPETEPETVTPEAETEEAAAEEVVFSASVKSPQYYAMPANIPAGKMMILSKQEAPSETSSSDDRMHSAAITVTGVIWESNPAYDGENEGKYLFTPVLPDGYVVEEGVNLPEIIVTVGESLPDVVAKLIASINALPEPADALKQSDKPWRFDVEAAEAVRGTLTDEQRAALPDNAAQKLDTLLHFLDVPVDCPDFDCPWHYPPEGQERMSEDETPALLTLDDLVTDYGIQQPRRLFSARTAVNPKTLIVTEDNENNAHTGTPDGDLDRIFNFWDNSHSIEVRFELDQVPAQSAYLAIKALDIDAGENDRVFVNGTKVGILQGMSNSWNTTVIEVPTSLLKEGNNYVTIKLDNTTYMNLQFQQVPTYSAQVDWVQLVLDGGAADSSITDFKIKLGEPFNSGEYAQIPVTATITQSGTTQYNTEYTLSGFGFWEIYNNIVIDSTSGKTAKTESTTLRLTKSRESGLYRISALLKDPHTGEIKAKDETTFYHVQNVGAELAPKVTHTLSPEALTNTDVEINITVEDNMGYTDVSINGDRHTAKDNGDYRIAVSYTVGGIERKFIYTVPVNNIDRIPPEIEYTPFVVEEGTVDAEIKRLFEAALSITEDRQLAGEAKYTLPANFAATMGEKKVTVTVADAAGNSVSKDCVVTVLPPSVRLTQKTPARVGATDSFTLSAVLADTGGLTFTETGFVWGVMENPTVRICNGRLATSSAVTDRNGDITVNASDIVDGVDYYARAYALAGGRAYYSGQMKFSIGEKKYGAFSVVNNGDSTFTITRADGYADTQKVYYRTVNGSAIGGTHFTHLADSVTFAQGETSKTVEVTEFGVDAVYGGNPATGYANADRTYQLEIYRVEGGGTIAAGGRATRRMEKNANKTIDRSIYEYRLAKEVTTKSGDDNYKIYEDEEGGYNNTAFVNELTCAALNGSVYPGAQIAYLNNTAAAMRFQLREFTAKDDTWTMQRYVVFSKSTSVSFNQSKGAKIPDPTYKGTKCVLIYSREGDTDSGEITSFSFPHPNGTTLGTGSTTKKAYAIRDARWESGQNENADYVLYELNETCYISIGSFNKASQNSYFIFNGAKLMCEPHDTREPQVLGVAPMAGGTYKPGDSITVAIVFDEIVDSTNSTLSGTTIHTNYGVMTYAGGADTTVLYYTGTVPAGASGQVILNSFSNPAGIKDMCPDTGTESAGTGSTGITVDSIVPTVSIAYGGIKNGTATGTITATDYDLLQYTWTQSAAMPVTGWITCASGDAAQTRQTSGEWYLHTLATRSANGATDYAKQSFNFGTPDNPTSPLPALTLSADSTEWAGSRDITVTRVPADAIVAYIGPQSGTAEGSTVTVTQNGIYTFTLTSGDETITEQVLVSKLDTVVPILTIQESDNIDAIYNELNFGVTASDHLSGIAKVEYNWSKTTTPGSWTEVKGTGKSYTIPAYIANETTQSTIYLHVRATDNAGNMTTQVSQGHTVVKALLPENLPAITLTGAPSAWTKGPVNLSWKVTGQGAGETFVNMGESDSTAVSGTLSADKNGLYSVMVTDKNRNSATATCLVDKIDAEAPILGSISCAPTGWANKKTVSILDVSDNRTPVFDADKIITGYDGSGLKTQEWKPESGTYTKFTGNSFEVESNGTYTVRLTDNVGNWNEYIVAVSGIDTAAPSVSVGTPAADWTSTAQNIKVIYTDEEGGSGIAAAQYAITNTNNGAKPTVLTTLPASGQSISVAANGTSYIYYRVTDNAGNVTDGYSAAIKVDTQAPALTVTGGTSGAASQTLTVTSAFGTSDGKVTVSKNSGTPEDVTDNSYAVTAKGAYTFTATSGAGKTAAVTINVYGITFDSKDGTDVPAQIVVSNGKATQPANPEKRGYTFVKWQKGNEDYRFSDEITSDISLTAVWTLNAPTVKLDVDNATAVYNGGETVATLTAKPLHDTAGISYTYEWYRNGTKLLGTDSTLQLTDVAHSGSYTVKVTAGDDKLHSQQVTSNEIAVTINKADTEITTAPAASGIIYGQALSDSTLDGGTATAASTSFLDRFARVFKSGKEVQGVFSWTTGTITPAVSDSGSTGYSITFTPADTANYNVSTAEITLTVDKKILTPLVNTVSDKEYDGNTAASGTIAFAGGVPGESPAAIGTFVFTNENAGRNKIVNVTDIALEGSWGDNYVLSADQLLHVVTTAEIKPKTIGLIWSGHTGLVYNTKSVSVTAAADGLVPEDSCTVTVIDGDKTNAGSYTAVATELSNSNYALPAVSTQNYNIAKAPVTFAVTDNIYDYDATEKNAAVVQTAGEIPNISGKFTVTYEQDGREVDAPINAGVYDVMVELNDANFKHDGKEDDLRKSRVGTLTINRVTYPPAAEGTMTWPAAENLTYGDLLSDSTLDGGNQTAHGTYTWNTPNTRPTVKNNGYLVTFTPANTSYSPLQQIVEITVTPKELTISGVTAADRDYIPANTTITVSGGSLQGVESGDNVILNQTGINGEVSTPDAEKGKEVTVTGYAITGEQADNYTLTQPEGLTVDITPATGIGSVTMDNWTYGDAAASPVPYSATNGVEQVSYSYSGIDAAGNAYQPSDICPTAAGSYNVTAICHATQNYKAVISTTSFTIEKRPLTIRWSNLYHTYNGSPGSPTAELVNRAEGDDDVQCGVILAGVQENVNTGRYTITAELTGEASFNYTLPVKNTEILIIQPAPVTFTVDDYSQQQDGLPKSAIVTAIPNVEHTVTYRLAGREIESPTEAGEYDIIVGISNPNYRFAEGADGKPRKAGVLTIFENKPPQTYTIEFEKGAESAEGTAPKLQAAAAGTIHLLPDNTFTNEGFAFIGWKNGNTLYQPQERFIQPANSSTVFTAQWKESTYDIGGVVNQEGKPLANVKVVLMRGTEQVAETVTNQQGKYTFTGVLSGLYNLVATKPAENGDIIQTVKTEVTGTDVDNADITMPLGLTNSVVDVSPGTPKIIVGNLEQTFSEVDDTVYTEADSLTVQNGGTVEIRFLAEQKEGEQIDETVTKELAAAAGRAKIQMYLELNIQKTIIPPNGLAEAEIKGVPNSNVLLEMVIPLPRELQGKQEYSIVRMHDNTPDTITETPNGDGEFFEVNAEKTEIILHAKKFSTYAIAYIEKSDGESGSDDDTGHTSTSSEQSETEQPAVEQPVIKQPVTEEPETPAIDLDSAKEEKSARTKTAENVGNKPEGEGKPQGGGTTGGSDQKSEIQPEQVKEDEPNKQENVQGTEENPFVVLNAVLALTGLACSIITAKKKKNRKRKMISAAAAVSAAAVFLLTTGWSSFALLNLWTIPVAALTILAAWGLFGKSFRERQ